MREKKIRKGREIIYKIKYKLVVVRITFGFNAWEAVVGFRARRAWKRQGSGACEGCASDAAGEVGLMATAWAGDLILCGARWGGGEGEDKPS